MRWGGQARRTGQYIFYISYGIHTVSIVCNVCIINILQHTNICIQHIRTVYSHTYNTVSSDIMYTAHTLHISHYRTYILYVLYVMYLQYVLYVQYVQYVQYVHIVY